MKTALVLGLTALAYVSAAFAFTKATYKDHVYVVDVKIDEGTGLVSAEFQNKPKVLPSVMELELKNVNKKPQKVSLSLSGQETQKYEGKLHAPYGNTISGVLSLHFDLSKFPGLKTVHLKPEK